MHSTSLVGLFVTSLLLAACSSAPMESDEAVGIASSDLLTCNSSPAAVGSAGDNTDQSTYLAAISASGNSLYVTHHSTPGGYQTSVIQLGAGITASGSWGSPTAPNEIKVITTNPGENYISIGGSINGVVTYSNIYFTGARFGLFGWADNHFTGVQAENPGMDGAPTDLVLSSRSDFLTLRQHRLPMYPDCGGISVSAVATGDGYVKLTAPLGGGASARFFIEREEVGHIDAGGAWVAELGVNAIKFRPGYNAIAAVVTDANGLSGVTPRASFYYTPPCYSMNRIYDPLNVRLGQTCLKYGTAGQCSATQGTMTSKCSTISSTCGYLYCL